jgi:hypothetical protein
LQNGKRQEHGLKDPPRPSYAKSHQYRKAASTTAQILVAAAAATAAAASSAAGEGLGVAVAGAVCGAEDGELEGVLFAGAFGAGDFLLLVDDDFFEVCLAVFADVFVDGHGGYLSSLFPL